MKRGGGGEERATWNNGAAANNFRTRKEQQPRCRGGRIKFHVERPNRKWKKRRMEGWEMSGMVGEIARVHRKREKGRGGR